MAKKRTKLSFDDFQALVKGRHKWLQSEEGEAQTGVEYRGASWGKRDLALAAQGPVGYIAHLHTQWKRGYDVKDGEIYDEIADAIIYLMLLVAEMGGETAEVLTRKFNVNSKEMGYSVSIPDYEGSS